MNKCTSILDIYNNYNRKYSPTDPRIVGWSNEESYNKRQIIVRKYASPNTNDTILDYGCGSMLSYYKEFEPKNYIGYDINRSSLEIASKEFNIPIVVDKYDYDFSNSKAVLISDFNIIKYHKFTKIIVNGVFQDFESISKVQSVIIELTKYLDDDGEIFIITPSNLNSRSSDKELFLSPNDLISVAIFTNRKFSLSYGELGQHIVFILGGRA